MGIHDREYYRDDPPGGGGLMGSLAPACKWLIAVTGAVFVAQLLTMQTSADATYWLSLSPQSVFPGGQIWRVVTYAFVHDIDNPMHILFNMLGLWMFGSQMEHIYGTREFGRFYVAAAAFSGLCYVLVAAATGNSAASLGASGAVMGVLMLCALHYPRQRILLFFVIPVELRWVVAAFVVWDMYPVLQELGGGRSGDQVAHAAHLGGLLFGFLYKHFDLRISGLFGGLGAESIRRFFRKRPAKVKLYAPPVEPVRDPNLDRRVDEILAKISEQGEASLTHEERKLLTEASRRYKQK